MERLSPERLTIKVWLFPWLSWLTIAAMLGVLVAMAFASELAAELEASLVAVAIVLLAYGVVRSRRRRSLRGGER
jgi:L-asparagine transporter-like permease